MTYRRRPSALHATRAAVACAWLAALAGLALAFEHPAILLAVLLSVVAAGCAAGVGRELGRAAMLAAPLALLIALINPIVSREGITVIARGGEVPVLGPLDITLEAMTYGGVLGLRVLVIVLCAALYAAAVDPDDVLRLFRRVGFRSALTATLATRMVPVLTRDSRRLAEAQRCRAPGGSVRPASRVALVRAVTAGALDRAVDVAATLEVRGYGTVRRAAPLGRPWSRHDLAFAASAVALAALGLGALVGGLGRFDAYPELVAPLGPAQLALGGAIVAAALLPFADRRGIAR